MTSVISRFAKTSVALSVSSSATVTSMATGVNTSEDHVPPYSHASTFYSSFNYPSAYDYTYPCPPYPTQSYAPPYTPSGLTQPYTPSYTPSGLTGPYYNHPFAYSLYNTPTSTSVFSEHPFTPKFITGRITKCQECGNKF